MKKVKHQILILVFMILYPFDFYGQTTLKGFVTNENNEAVSAMIEDIKGRGFFFCDNNGYFEITIPENSSKIEFSAFRYLPVRVDIDTIDKNQIRIKLTQDSRYKELIMIAPSPPFIEIGYYGRMSNSPLGIHSSIGGWGSKHHLEIDYATKDFNSNNYINLSYSPGIIDFKKNRKINALINPYFTGTYSNFDKVQNSRFLICNNTWIKDFISINYGLGFTIEDNPEIIYNVGLRKGFNLPSINPYVPLFYQSYLKLDIFVNNEIFDWSSKLYFEFYNKSYRRLSFAVGYESIYGYEDFVFSINFKNYLFNREQY